MSDTRDLERKFWKAIEDDRTMMLGIAGGLLLLMLTGPGRYSFDRR